MPPHHCHHICTPCLPLSPHIPSHLLLPSQFSPADLRSTSTPSIPPKGMITMNLLITTKQHDIAPDHLSAQGQPFNRGDTECANLHQVFEGAQTRRSSRLAPYASDGLPTRSMNAELKCSGMGVHRRQHSKSATPSRCETAGSSAWTTKSAMDVPAPTRHTSLLHRLQTVSSWCTGLPSRREVLRRRKMPYHPDAWEELLRAQGSF